MLKVNAVRPLPVPDSAIWSNWKYYSFLKIWFCYMYQMHVPIELMSNKDYSNFKTTLKDHFK